MTAVMAVTAAWPAHNLSGYQAIRQATRFWLSRTISYQAIRQSDRVWLSGNFSYQEIKAYQEILPIMKIVVIEYYSSFLYGPAAR